MLRTSSPVTRTLLLLRIRKVRKYYCPEPFYFVHTKGCFEPLGTRIVLVSIASNLFAIIQTKGCLEPLVTRIIRLSMAQNPFPTTPWNTNNPTEYCLESCHCHSCKNVNIVTKYCLEPLLGGLRSRNSVSQYCLETLSLLWNYASPPVVWVILPRPPPPRGFPVLWLHVLWVGPRFCGSLSFSFPLPPAPLWFPVFWATAPLPVPGWLRSLICCEGPKPNSRLDIEPRVRIVWCAVCSNTFEKSSTSAQWYPCVVGYPFPPPAPVVRCLAVPCESCEDYAMVAKQTSTMMRMTCDCLLGGGA